MHQDIPELHRVAFATISPILAVLFTNPFDTVKVSNMYHLLTFVDPITTPRSTWKQCYVQKYVRLYVEDISHRRFAFVEILTRRDARITKGINPCCVQRRLKEYIQIGNV